MSGDVQPRKRKDKKKKKDDLGIEEPRGTAAALGEGDIFMHSHHEHSTGGNWCAKVIFFSLLAVLVTLIGLIILENRGLSELEANSVESRYSGVLEGWLEEGHDDDHHDEHTLELNHHDDEEDDDHDDLLDHDDDNHDDDDDDDHEEQSHEDDDEDEDNEKNQDEDDELDQNEDDDGESQEKDDEADQNDADSQQDDDDENEYEDRTLETAEDEDEVEEKSYRRYYRSTENQAKDDDDDDDDLEKADNIDDESEEKDDHDEQNDNEEDDDEQNNDDDQENDDIDEEDNGDDDEKNDDDDKNQLNTYDEENDQDEDDEDHDDHNDHEEDSEVELEHIEEEVLDEDLSTEAPATARRTEASEEKSKEALLVDDSEEDEVELLEPDDSDELPEELPIPMPKGRPLVEVEDTTSTEKPQDTLADEEEYERQQEALRKEKEEASQGMWLKVVVGGALLVATQAVLRRATAPRESEDEVDTTREETPLSDRRMTLIAESSAVTPLQEVSRPIIQKEVVRQAPEIKSASPPEDEEEEEGVEVEEEEIIVSKDEKDKELYSDEEEEVEDEEEEDVVEQKEEPKPNAPTTKPPQKPVISKSSTPMQETSKPPLKESPEKREPPKIVQKEPTPEDDEDDDVEIIEEEDIAEDLEDEEEDISDVDDAELLNRLEAKYGRLPEPEIPGKKSKGDFTSVASLAQDGGNSIEDEWPGEPSDAYWRDELDRAEQDLRQGEWMAAAERASAAVLRSSARARYIVARALDLSAEAKRDNGLLSKAIAAYLELLKMNENLTNKKLIEVTDRALDRMKFRGNYLSTEPIYRLLIRRFPDDPNHHNNLTISFLMANRADLAEKVIKETLKLWPNDRLALAHHGFILKTLHNKQEEAVDAFLKALDGDTGPANEARYYYHLGDSLLLLGRFKEAHEVHKRGAKLGHFLSPAQRSLYNVDRLKSQPWWDVEKTPYSRLARALEKSWKEILKEGRAAQALYEKEKEGLKEKGEWSQLDLFARGREVEGRCSRAPVTCGIVRSEAAAVGCRRGQIKFSLMEAGTHVRPHVGPTNCRLRMHLGLSNTKDTYIRVDKEIRQWDTGKVLMFDDSFEHEVWHNGTGARLVLIVDVWHPDLTRTERMQLPAI